LGKGFDPDVFGRFDLAALASHTLNFCLFVYLAADSLLQTRPQILFMAPLALAWAGLMVCFWRAFNSARSGRLYISDYVV
jgi:hypothetical protein